MRPSVEVVSRCSGAKSTKVPGGEPVPISLTSKGTCALMPARSTASGTARLERYRPNIVIRTATTGFTENDWLERILRIGDELTLRVIARTPRCAVPTLAHGDLPRDAEALRVLAQHNRVEPLESSEPEPCAGVYAEVLIPGRIRTGDLVRMA